jgi:predicted transcriptional regulator
VSLTSASIRAELHDPPRLHELEAEVMEEVWQQGEVTVRDVMNALNVGAAKERAYTTYMTIMARLDGKRMLVRRRLGKTDCYRAILTRDEYADMRARAEVDSIVDQYGELALAHLARQMAQLDPKRRRALERLARGR